MTGSTGSTQTTTPSGPTSHPDWRDLALDAWEDEQEQLRAEAEYASARKEYQ